ncbi:MAG: hypothetical protein ACREC6_04590 [Hyphomicrobiaceae bacterium]
MSIERLRHVLDVCGADEARWPTHLRAPLRRLIEQNARARTLFRESKALDRLLAQAPPPSRAGERELTERIVAAVARSSGRRARPAHRAVWRPGLWAASAALAASLLLGIFVGTANTPATAGAVALLADMTPMAVHGDPAGSDDEDAL